MKNLQARRTAKTLARTLLWAALAVTTASAQATKQEPRLKLNETLERELAGNEVHEYLVTLKAGEFVQVRVEQKGIDLEVKLYANARRMLLEMDSPSGMEGPETLSWIAVTAGNYRFEVSRLNDEANAQSGKYSITLTARNAATEDNRRRLKAERMFVQVVKTPLHDRQQIPSLLRRYETLLTVWGELHDEQMVSLVKSVIARLREAYADSEAEAKAEEESAKKAKLVVQTNHGLLVQSVAFSLDGRILATGGGDGVIKLWDVETGRQLRSTVGHPGMKMMDAEEPLPAKSKDWLVRIFEEMDGGAAHTVHSLAFSPDGKTFASGSTDKTIRVWELATGRQLKIFTQPIRVWLVAYNQDGSKLLSIAEDGSHRYWDVAGEQEITDDPSPLSSFRLPWQSPLGRLTAVYDESRKTIEVIDSTTNRKKILVGHEAGVRRAVFSNDGQTLASCGWDRTVRLWDMRGVRRPHTPCR